MNQEQLKQYRQISSNLQEISEQLPDDLSKLTKTASVGVDSKHQSDRNIVLETRRNMWLENI